MRKSDADLFHSQVVVASGIEHAGNFSSSKVEISIYNLKMYLKCNEGVRTEAPSWSIAV